ncbi:MAG: U32 family peptidase [Candidatus Cloacimonetes bacterium]|nr:U32 family peptidase [Candidatus Cloacimonadota bacterium]
MKQKKEKFIAAKKPELLLPVGNIEAFYAAIAGGADAVYLGLSSFNARGRAKNFTIWQLQWLITYALRKKVKIYVTLNTLIKNKELPELLNFLHLLQQVRISALIIQDWGVYQIVRKYFPNFEIHASTQMGVHNSVGTTLFKQLGFQRTILSRELTMPEIETIAEKSDIELEVFVHGALCYSFSGYCLFSSYLGGMSGNRGLCRQPCRRRYNLPESEEYLFSLKDLQLIEKIPALIRLGISSLKIEGRMRTAEYVYKVAQAYRMALDNPEKMKDAIKLLSEDTGREKTAYFAGGNLQNSITDQPYTGIYAGEISKLEKGFVSFRTECEFSVKDRIRVFPQSDEDTPSFRVSQIQVENKPCDSVKRGVIVNVSCNTEKLAVGDKVYVTSRGDIRFKSKFPTPDVKKISKLSPRKQQDILAGIGTEKTFRDKQELVIRIDNPSLLDEKCLEKADWVILNFEQKEWEKFVLNNNLPQNNKTKMIPELPRFIPESKITFYQKMFLSLYRLGFVNFAISHFSQKLLLPRSGKIKLWSNENVYVMNDAACDFVTKSVDSNFIYPLETDFENLFNMKNKSGIVPVYFVPQLFYSRMPIAVKDDTEFSDKEFSYRKITRDSFSITVPELPVCIFKHRTKLIQHGFSRFLIDLSLHNQKQLCIDEIFRYFHDETAIKNSRGFNFKKGLW